jgi:hypothetical protein
VTLRKQKRCEILTSKRLKIDQTLHAHYSSDHLTSLCARVVSAIRQDEDVLPALTDLRKLFSSQNFVDA